MACEKIKMRKILRYAFCLLGAPALAGGTAGDFDYYVLALSWSPNWCALEGDARGAEQCDPAYSYGWTVHGLWPQYEEGWPTDCPTRQDAPTRRQSDRMADIMGSAGLAFYEWRKHGTCSGLSGADYYTTLRRAYDTLTIPPEFARLTDQVTLPARLIQEAFIAANPDLSPDAITITCDDGYIQEARICLTPDLTFRDCAPDTRRDCTLQRALFDPVR